MSVDSCIPIKGHLTLIVQKLFKKPVQIDLILIYLYIKYSTIDCSLKKLGCVCAPANKVFYSDQVTFQQRQSIIESIMANPILNDLLNQLPDAQLQRLLPHLQLVSLSAGDVLYAQGEKDVSVYFPLNCLIAVAIDLSDGNTVDTLIVGAEGVVGLRSLEVTPSCHRVYVTLSGLAYKMSSAALLSEANEGNAIYKMCFYSAVKAMRRMSLEVACINFHSIEQRMAKWILMRHDLTSENFVKTTHQTIAQSMGVRREAITLAGAKLKGLEHSRGLIEITDRSLLEKFACGCYFEQIHAQPAPKLL